MMNRTAVLWCALILMASPMLVHAADETTQPAQVAQAAVAMTEGEVRKIDRDAGKLTIRHGPIVNLDMQAMTMSFRVSDPVMLDALKVGDKIRFVVERVNGAMLVTRIETQAQ
jgi:Cu/Ag efflux protein CusF